MISFTSVRILLLSWIGLGFLACLAKAEVVWPVTSREMETHSFQDSISIRFPFRNTGPRPIRIVSVDSGCSCTSARNRDAVYAPGADHELILDFTVGGRVGRQERDIVVVTDDAPQKPHRLRLVVNIAELVTIHPRLLYWRIGEAPDEKDLEITLARPGAMRLDPPSCQTGDFLPRLVPGLREGIFILKIAPPSTAQRRAAVIQVVAHFEDRSQTLTIFAAVK